MRYLLNGAVKKGFTVAHLHANQHYFMDMTVGFRVEEPSNVKIIPCSMDKLLTANDKIHQPPPATCSGWARWCQKTENLARCSTCHKAQFCSKDHQAAAWKDEHRTESKAFVTLEWLRVMEKNWKHFHDLVFLIL
ncbi:hypothetical protein BKA93DRAFT_188753 [Sparassis latifolia]